VRERSERMLAQCLCGELKGSLGMRRRSWECGGNVDIDMRKDNHTNNS
jgi:hypothetical protein